MILVCIILVSLLVGLSGGILFAKIREKAVGRKISTCPKCGRVSSVSADPSNSRLAIECKGKDCGYHSVLPVRASALSLFGLARLDLTIVCGILGFGFGWRLGFRLVGNTLVALACMIIGGIVIGFFIRLICFSLLRSNVSPIWQKEIVAHLAPSPFTNKQPVMEAKSVDPKTVNDED